MVFDIPNFKLKYGLAMAPYVRSMNLTTNSAAGGFAGRRPSLTFGSKKRRQKQKRQKLLASWQQVGERKRWQVFFYFFSRQVNTTITDIFMNSCEGLGDILRGSTAGLNNSQARNNGRTS